VNVLDLFSGIGGFSLGLERAGMRTVAFCEIEPYCQAVLAKRWPHVPCHPDIRKLAGVTADVICGGFPCQDISLAGSGEGLAGERSGLWSEFARLIGEVRPRYVIVENVAALLGRGIGEVLGNLAALGYDAEWHCIPASYVGAPHRRDRIWIVAYSNGAGSPLGPWFTRMACAAARSWPGIAAANGSWWSAEPAVGRVVNGLPGRVDRVRALGNSLIPQIVEIIGRAIMRAAVTEEPSL
jgi:DNA (cytosine-5)-methyltransferase 1